MPAMPILSDALADSRQRVEAALEQHLPAPTRIPARLHEAMRYAALTPGKRLRPFLVYQAAALFNERGPQLDAPACAVELIHAYSLVHDDLPAMDDDDLRRGQATCHRAFDEASAILAGDALQALAFELIATASGIDAERRNRMLAVLAAAVGSRGMAGGQALDLAAVGRQLDTAELEAMHLHKTGALILASLRLGSLAAGGAVSDAQHKALEHYGRCIGLAFQVRDDVLDVTGDSAHTGKTSGADARRDKPTYPGLMGLAAARQFADALRDEAVAALAAFGSDAETLRLLADYVVQRDH